MPKPYSIDLRQRVLQYLEKTDDKMKASQLFQVGIATIYRWVARRKQNGNIEPLTRKSTYKKIDDQKLIAYVEQNPDHFLSEIAKHFGLTLQAIFYALRRLKITRKKRLRSTRREMKKLGGISSKR
jgi:transposase